MVGDTCASSRLIEKRHAIKPDLDTNGEIDAGQQHAAKQRVRLWRRRRDSKTSPEGKVDGEVAEEMHEGWGIDRLRFQIVGGFIFEVAGVGVPSGSKTVDRLPALAIIDLCRRCQGGG
jgi:hypothetical protein